MQKQLKLRHLLLHLQPKNSLSLGDVTKGTSGTMRNITKFLGLCVVLITCVAFAQNAGGTGNQATPPPAAFQKIKLLQSEGKLLDARRVTLDYVKQYPNDLDMKVLLASIYAQLNDFRSSKELLQAVLAKDPKEADALELMQKVTADEMRFHSQAKAAMANPVASEAVRSRDDYLTKIQNQLASENYKAALASANKGLKTYPNDSDLLKAKSKALYGLGEFNGPSASFHNASTFTPQNLQATEVLNAIVGETGKEYGKNQLGFNQQSIIATSPDGYWDFTNLYYTHDTDFGMMLSC